MTIQESLTVPSGSEVAMSDGRADGTKTPFVSGERQRTEFYRPGVNVDAMSDDDGAPSDKQKYEFTKVLEELDEYSGSGTQLVSIYVPEDRLISDVVAHVTQEHSEASNIKSKQTRTAVQDALTSIKDRLKYYDVHPPDNGMVVFSGAVDSGGGQTEMVTEVLESPPEPTAPEKTTMPFSGGWTS